MLRITIIHVKRGQQKGNSQGEQVKLHQVKRQPQHIGSELHPGKNTSNHHDTQVDQHADKCIDSCRNNDDVLRKVDLSKKVTPGDD